jgi:hypothetical protein
MVSTLHYKQSGPGKHIRKNITGLLTSHYFSLSQKSLLLATYYFVKTFLCEQYFF